MNRHLLYQLIYALAARDGRDAALFGECAPLASEAFERSLAGDCFPELWFELPLAGKPWFDLHALVTREDLDANAVFDPATCGGVPNAFKWFASQGSAARQLALSWDVGSGDIEGPAVQLLKRTDDTRITCDFLESVERPDAAAAYRAFEQRLPRGWFACYAGVFPRRKEPFLRVECIPSLEQQRIYAENPDVLAEHLGQVGFAVEGDTLLPRCQVLANAPFQIEFQFDVTPDGTAGRTFSASARFAQPKTESVYEPFDADGEAGDLMRQVEAWGLADERWRLLAGTIFSKRANYGKESSLLFCFPAFLKLRWREGEQVDAKAYLIAGALSD